MAGPRPAALAEGADLAALRPLLQVEWMEGGRFGGMWEGPPAGSEAERLLEASVRDEFKRFL